jgi:hypothetical protein
MQIMSNVPVELHPQIDPNVPAIPATHEQILYFLSSTSGLGHASRAVAIAQEMAFHNEASITFAAHPNAHEFLHNNLAHTGLDYEVASLNYAAFMPDDEFVAINGPIFGRLSCSNVVTNDFLTQINSVRTALSDQSLTAPLVGVYHSIEGYAVDDIGVKTYQDAYRAIAKSLHVLFLAEPKLTHMAPYEMDNGTLVVPCDPVVRKPTKSPEQVKLELGLQPEDEFIFVQGGMSGSGELREFIDSLSGLSIKGLKLVLAPFRAGLEQFTLDGEHVIHMPKRMDAQNIVAASQGIISKPGMGIMGEAIANAKPLLFVHDYDPERIVKYVMLQQILGNELPFLLTTEKPIMPQINDWLEAAPEISQQFSAIPCEGAAKLARAIPRIGVEGRAIYETDMVV